MLQNIDYKNQGQMLTKTKKKASYLNVNVSTRDSHFEPVFLTVSYKGRYVCLVCSLLGNLIVGIFLRRFKTI